MDCFYVSSIIFAVGGYFINSFLSLWEESKDLLEFLPLICHGFIFFIIFYLLLTQFLILFSSLHPSSTLDFVSASPVISLLFNYEMILFLYPLKYSVWPVHFSSWLYHQCLVFHLVFHLWEFISFRDLYLLFLVELWLSFVLPLFRNMSEVGVFVGLPPSHSSLHIWLLVFLVIVSLVSWMISLWQMVGVRRREQAPSRWSAVFRHVSQACSPSFRLSAKSAWPKRCLVCAAVYSGVI